MEFPGPLHPDAACEPLGVEALHPGDFLLNLYDLDHAAVHAAIERQALELTDPPKTTDEVLNALATVVPSFAQTAGAYPVGSGSPWVGTSRP